MDLRGSLGPQLAQILTPEIATDQDPELRAERQRCRDDVVYFVDTYCWILDVSDPLNPVWIRFHLFEAQKELLRTIHRNRQVQVLKARQLGISWLGLSYALWLMLFYPNSQVSIFSKGQEEANYLLGDDRLKGMHAHLPSWLLQGVVLNNEKTWRLQNGSIARAFPPNRGDSYTVSFVFIDEHDLCEDQRTLMGSVKPSTDGGGKILSVSRANAKTPQSDFKKMFRAAMAGTSPWVPVFLPWTVRPGRDEAWYEDKKQEIMARTGSLDELREHYPATAAEAMSGLTQDKLIPPAWVAQCWVQMDPVVDLDNYLPTDQPLIEWRGFPDAMPFIPGLKIYHHPRAGSEYLIGSDPAEGNSHSDASSTHVVDRFTGEEVAMFSGKHIPETHASYTLSLALYYNHAKVLPERNNHGHAFILQVKTEGKTHMLLDGPDKKPGWNTTAASKTIMYDVVSPYFRERDCIIHTYSTFVQITSLEAKTRSAPEGEHDDEAISFVLAQAARTSFQPYTEPITEDTIDYSHRDSSYRFS